MTDNYKVVITTIIPGNQDVKYCYCFLRKQKAKLFFDKFAKGKNSIKGGKVVVELLHFHSDELLHYTEQESHLLPKEAVIIKYEYEDFLLSEIKIISVAFSDGERYADLIPGPNKYFEVFESLEELKKEFFQELNIFERINYGACVVSDFIHAH